ncbi:MAG: polysaccharide deacetylase family protein [Clostridiales bacterium]|nr:polysaccharide deacetylase family protein [Clostridiales bacterium]
MKQTLIAVSVTLVCVLLVCGMGGYAQAFANKKEVPIYCVDRDDNYVSISFDAAWGADKTRQIMDVCDRYNVKATFFLVGFWVDKYPEMVGEIALRGFEIGTHSATHPQMSKLSESQCRDELVNSSKKIFEITGKPVTLFRPPFGDYNNQLLAVAKGLGLYTVQWSIDSLDWKGLTARQIAERVQKATSGDVILCHNNSDHIVEALPLIFEALQLKGLKFCPIGELIYKDNYYIDNTGKQIRDTTAANNV